MALRRSGEIPKDAVILSDDEASGYIWEVVSNWDSLSESWALRHGATILGAINSLAGVLINRHYRWRFRLGTYGYVASTLPIVVMPGMITVLLHRHLISTEILLMNKPTCPVCYEVKSTVMQVGFGLIYPMVLGPTSALMFANRYATYRVPPLQGSPKVMLKFLKQHTTKLYPTLTYLLTAQVLASAVITYFEMKNNMTVQRRLNEIEAKLQNGELL